jgi:hypothetical protein
VADEEALLVVVGVDEPAGDAVRAVADDLAGLRLEHVHPFDLDAQPAVQCQPGSHRLRVVYIRIVELRAAW